MKEQLLDRFSPSMLIDYLSCPKLFYYRYIAKIQIPQKQIHLLFGSGVHAAIEGMYVGQDPYPLFEKTFVKDKLMDDEKEKYEEFMLLGKEMIKNYSKEHPTLDSLYDLNNGKSELYIRRKLRNPLTGEETSLPISGRIDRLTDKGRIIEYKTSSKKWNPDDLNYKIQTYLYNLWYLTEYDELPEETVYIILLKKFKKADKTETTQVLTQNCSIIELASVFEEVELILDKIRSREFGRPTGFHPKWCDCHTYEKYLNINQ